jgi:hypothetical protein
VARTKSKIVKKPARRKPGGKAAPAAPVAQPVRIARVAKGKKPQYFSDPAIDKLLWMTMTLMEELSVTRDRLDTVERVLANKRVLKAAEIEGYIPTEIAASERSTRRAAFVDRMMRAVHAELDEVTARGAPDGNDDAVAAVSS